MKNLMTFDEYKNLDEGTIGSWAKKGALLGAVGYASTAIASGLAIGGAALSGGLALAIPLAVWGAMGGLLGGTVGGVLFAGGQARKDLNELKGVMKKIGKAQMEMEKTAGILDKKVDLKDIKNQKKDAETYLKFDTKHRQLVTRARFLVDKLKKHVQGYDMGDSKGLLRTDIRNKQKVIDGLEQMDAALKEAEKHK